METHLFTFKQNKEMKTITRILGVTLTVAMFIFLDACKAEKGDIGPIGSTGANGTNGTIGATGATGATGTTGAKGDKGDKGDPGAGANVLQVTFNSTFVPPNAPTPAKVFTFPSAITTNILDNSALLVYIKTSNYTDTWYPVSGAAVYPGGTVNPYVADVLRYFLIPSARTVSIARESGSAISSIIATRCVIIPATTISTGRKAAVDFSDYEAVKKFYNLPD